MTFLFQITRKVVILRYATRGRWLELAAWSTRRSALKGWRWQNTAAPPSDDQVRAGDGRRLITPWLGFAVWIG